MKTIVSAKHVKKIYGAQGNLFPALGGVDLTVHEGEFIGIMGPSGSGKTTLLNILATIDEATSGEIIVDGININGMNEHELSDFRRNKLGFIFQDYNLLDTLTVKENIILPLALSKTDVADLDDRVALIADKFNIAPLLSKYPYQISGGQKQRTAAARAIITRPSLVLADEPTGALDSKAATDLLQALTSLNEKDGATILIVTHDAFAASFCRRVLFLRDGEIFTEIVKGDHHRKDFFKKILDVLTILGGNANDAV